MGTPIEPPDPFGDDCLQCYEPGETPKFLYATIKGISMGSLWHEELGPPPNGTYKLEQVEDVPCYWAHVAPNWAIGYYAMAAPTIPGGSGLYIDAGFPFIVAFWGENAEPCITKFETILTEPPDRIFKGGTGWVFSKTEPEEPE